MAELVAWSGRQPQLANCTREAAASVSLADRGWNSASSVPVGMTTINLLPCRAADAICCCLAECLAGRWLGPAHARLAQPSPGVRMVRPALRALRVAACTLTSAAQPTVVHTAVSERALASACLHPGAWHRLSREPYGWYCLRAAAHRAGASES